MSCPMFLFSKRFLQCLFLAPLFVLASVSVAESNIPLELTVTEAHLDKGTLHITILLENTTERDVAILATSLSESGNLVYRLESQTPDLIICSPRPNGIYPLMVDVKPFERISISISYEVRKARKGTYVCILTPLEITKIRSASFVVCVDEDVEERPCSVRTKEDLRWNLEDNSPTQ